MDKLRIFVSSTRLSGIFAKPKNRSETFAVSFKRLEVNDQRIRRLLTGRWPKEFLTQSFSGFEKPAMIWVSTFRTLVFRLKNWVFV
jgi:hypothetical protein